MFEAIKAFHEALRTDSTWPFVALMAIGGALLVALLAWVTDVSYKRKLEALSETVYPIVDFDFATEERTPPKLFLKITDRGEFQLRNVQMEVTEYALQQRKAITQMSKFGGAALLTKQINSRGGESEPFDLQKGMPLQLEPLADNPPSTPVPAKERFYALRFTFLHGGKKRFCFYKVTSSTAPYLLLDESTSAWGWSTAGAHLPIAVGKDWITAPRNLILDDQHTIPWPDNAEEYIPNRKPHATQP